MEKQLGSSNAEEKLTRRDAIQSLGFEVSFFLELPIQYKEKLAMDHITRLNDTISHLVELRRVTKELI